MRAPQKTIPIAILVFGYKTPLRSSSPGFLGFCGIPSYLLDDLENLAACGIGREAALGTLDKRAIERAVNMIKVKAAVCSYDEAI